MNTLQVVFSLLLCLAFTAEDVNGSPLFRRRRNQNPLPNPQTTKSPPIQLPQAVPQYGRAIVKTLDTKVTELLCHHGITTGTIPQGEVNLLAKNAYDASVLWSLAQNDLEKLFQKELLLEHRPKLFLVLKQTLQINGRKSIFFVISDPRNNTIKDVLCRVLSTTIEIFDDSINPIGESSTIVLEQFKPELMLGGELNAAKAQGLILELLQTDKELASCASKLNGAFKPTVKNNDLTHNSFRIVSAWQDLAADENVRVSWRAYISLNKHPCGAWMLESVVEFGERKRTQSPDQIQRITDTDQIGMLDVIEGEKISPDTQIVRVQYKSLRSHSELKFLTNETKDAFAELSPLMWQKVKSKLLKN